MRVGLLTDAPKHNLALMRISAYHKAKGDEVILNQPLIPCDLSYGSWLYHQDYPTDYAGGSAVDPAIRLPQKFEGGKPDYTLYPIDYSLGFTWEYCPRKCGFCCVPKQNNPKKHRSISEFHEPKFKKICLLNNNTFTDPRWRETFEEISGAGLAVIDENGYDLRLLDDEKVDYLNRARFEGTVHFSWDEIGDEPAIRRGLQVLKGIKHRTQIYVLIGYPGHRPIDDTDIHRCQVITDHGFDPFVMIYNNSRDKQLRQYRWLTNRGFSWRQKGFKAMWEEGYRAEKRGKGR